MRKIIYLILMFAIIGNSKENFVSSTFMGFIFGNFEKPNTQGVTQWELAFSKNLNDSIAILGTYIYTGHSGGLDRKSEDGLSREIDQFDLKLNFIEAEVRYLFSKNRRHYVAGNMGAGVFSSTETSYYYSKSVITTKVSESGSPIESVDKGIAYNLGVNYGYLYRNGFVFDASIGPTLGKVRTEHGNEENKESYRRLSIIGNTPILEWLTINASIAIGWEF